MFNTIVTETAHLFRGDIPLFKKFFQPFSNFLSQRHLDAQRFMKSFVCSASPLINLPPFIVGCAFDLRHLNHTRLSRESRSDFHVHTSTEVRRIASHVDVCISEVELNDVARVLVALFEWPQNALGNSKRSHKIATKEIMSMYSDADKSEPEFCTFQEEDDAVSGTWLVVHVVPCRTCGCAQPSMPQRVHCVCFHVRK